MPALSMPGVCRLSSVPVKLNQEVLTSSAGTAGGAKAGPRSLAREAGAYAGESGGRAAKPGAGAGVQRWRRPRTPELGQSASRADPSSLLLRPDWLSDLACTGPKAFARAKRTQTREARMQGRSGLPATWMVCFLAAGSLRRPKTAKTKTIYI